MVIIISPLTTTYTTTCNTSGHDRNNDTWHNCFDSNIIIWYPNFSYVPGNLSACCKTSSWSYRWHHVILSCFICSFDTSYIDNYYEHRNFLCYNFGLKPCLSCWRKPFFGQALCSQVRKWVQCGVIQGGITIWFTVVHWIHTGSHHVNDY